MIALFFMVVLATPQPAPQVHESLVEVCRAETGKAPEAPGSLVAVLGDERRARARRLARRLGTTLIEVPLSRYIGETEKNLDALFARAKVKGAVLFFDEADALFGKRTSVRDAHDRYANLETNHLVSRLRAPATLVVVGLRRAPQPGARLTATLGAQLRPGKPTPWRRLCR